eukprot:136647-Rhodomonas_salina.1
MQPVPLSRGRGGQREGAATAYGRMRSHGVPSSLLLPSPRTPRVGEANPYPLARPHHHARQNGSAGWNRDGDGAMEMRRGVEEEEYEEALLVRLASGVR